MRCQIDSGVFSYGLWTFRQELPNFFFCTILLNFFSSVYVYKKIFPMDFVCLRHLLKERNPLRFLFSLVRGAVTNLTVSEDCAFSRTHVFKGGKNTIRRKKFQKPLIVLVAILMLSREKNMPDIMWNVRAILLKQRLMCFPICSFRLNSLRKILSVNEASFSKNWTCIKMLLCIK